MTMQVAVVLYAGVTALDAIGPYEVLRSMPGARVRFVGHEVGPVMTDSGVLTLGVTHTFEQTPSPDVVVVPGSPRPPMDDGVLRDWLVGAHASATWTTSVCTGSLLLGAAGLLNGHPATTHWLAREALPAFGATPSDERVVRSGRLVTAAGVSAGIDLALWLAGQLHGRDVAETIQLMIEYDPQPPFDAGHTSKARPSVIATARAAFAALA